MLNEEVAYRNCICLGHILDREGRKMSKSRPETFVGPWDVLEKYGADAFRWYMYTSGSPGEPRRFSVELVGDVVRSFYLTLWNCFSFFTTYAPSVRIDVVSSKIVSKRGRTGADSEVFRRTQKISAGQVEPAT